MCNGCTCIYNLKICRSLAVFRELERWGSGSIGLPENEFGLQGGVSGSGWLCEFRGVALIAAAGHVTQEEDEEEEQNNNQKKPKKTKKKQNKNKKKLMMMKQTKKKIHTNNSLKKINDKKTTQRKLK